MAAQIVLQVTEHISLPDIAGNACDLSAAFVRSANPQNQGSQSSQLSSCRVFRLESAGRFSLAHQGIRTLVVQLYW